MSSQLPSSWRREGGRVEYKNKNEKGIHSFITNTYYDIKLRIYVYNSPCNRTMAFIFDDPLPHNTPLPALSTIGKADTRLSWNVFRAVIMGVSWEAWGEGGEKRGGRRGQLEGERYTVGR